MSATPAGIAIQGAPAISFFERYLTLWVALCIIAGVVFAQVLPDVSRAIGSLEVVHVNTVGLLIWVMIVPMLVKIDFGAIGQVRGYCMGIAVANSHRAR